MILADAPGVRHLGDCDCCEGRGIRTPADVANRPGLRAIAYRVGTHASVKASLLARLSVPEMSGLAALTARADDDFAIALLDAWATVADIVTFYQERIATESYLRTATERLSVRELARLIGYALRPGVAAQTRLAFSLEDGPGAPRRISLAPGIKVQSVPGAGEEPQTYETVAAIDARPAWNAMRPRLAVPHPLAPDTTALFVAGISVNARAGEALIFRAGPAIVLAAVDGASVEPERGRTRLAVTPRHGGLKAGSDVPALAPVVVPVGPPAPAYLGQTWGAADLAAEAEAGGFDLSALFDALAASPPPAPRAMLFRTRAGIFGHNAPADQTLPFALDPGAVDLDAPYPGIGAGGHVVLRNGETDVWGVYRVARVAELSRAVFGMSGKVTRLVLEGSPDLTCFGLRSTTVFAQPEELALAPLDREDDFPGAPGVDGLQWIELQGWVDGLGAGQRAIVSGEDAATPGLTAVEAGEIDRVEHVLARGAGTRIALAAGLARHYRRASVRINANVAPATHGESVLEVLGGGDPTIAHQRFTLKQPPLTHVSAATASGTASTLEVRVGGVRWREIPTLLGAGPADRVYRTRLEADGRTTIQFGDGVEGARLPAGQDNLRATYRRGIGRAGRVAAQQLSLLLSRPLGLRAVTNPLAASGGDDAEAFEDARRNAPLTVLTLGRIVSLKDHEDFARAHAGIARAHAGWDAGRRRVVITVAGAGGQVVGAGDAVFHTLLEAMRLARDGTVGMIAVPFRPERFRVALRVKVHPDHLATAVLPAVERALRAAYAFAARDLGQPVTLSHVVATAQGVAGVVAVDLDRLYRVPDTPGPSPEPRLVALPADLLVEPPLGTEMLTLDPGPLDHLMEMP